MHGVLAMSFVEKRDVFRPSNGDSPFQIEEIFFSRTDKRGIILAANFIFQRVSGYSWEELLGSPHKMVRHPDMPKGVFWLFWDALNKGEPIGAYVKNKAKDGLHYWVYAVAMPFQDGFLSIRIKPTSDMLTTIQAEYEVLRNAELEDGVSAEDSAASLTTRIEALGYADYSIFASDALMHELRARDEKMDNLPSETADRFDKMIAAANFLHDETAALIVSFDAISTVPTNMRIIAARLEPSGGAISSLSQNYWEMSEEMSLWFQSYVSGEGSNFSSIRSTLVSSQFLCGTARVLQEVATKFNSERRSLGGVDVAEEKDQMNEMAGIFIAKAKIGLQQVANEAEQILRAVSMMRRFTLGLSSTRVMCNIESARLPSGGNSLIDVIKQLEVFQGELVQQLDRIEAQGHTILECTEAQLAKLGS